MELSVKTKFNVGDTVYAPEFYEVYWTDPVPYIITDIFIKVTRAKDISITYHLLRDDLTDVISENFLFGTYEECKRWCEIQNKEG